MKQSADDAVKFLQFLYPNGPWLLTAIPVERTHAMAPSPPTRTFMPGEEKDVAHWLASFEVGVFNFYFSVNEPMGKMSKKANRLEIKQMTMLHVDIDPRTIDPKATDDEKRRHTMDEQHRIEGMLTDKLPKGIPQPSAVIYSGGGYWGFWILDEPFEIRKSAERYEEAKLYNLQLETVFGADSCHNVDRIARLPGTINYPDAKKRKKGRTAQMARVLYTNSNVYPISAFTKAPQLQAKRDGFSTGRTINVSENVQRIDDLDKELPATVKGYTKRVIAMGEDEDDPNKWSSRSDALWYVVCELVRCGCTDDQIYAIITDPDWGISESVVDGSNGRGDGYARRQIERAREFAVDPKLADFNNRYAVVQNTGGGSCRIVYEDSIDGHKVMVMQTPGDFKAFYSNEFITVAAGNATRQIPAGKWWFEHPLRRSYRTIVFLPGQEVPNDVYNLWRGFAYEARPGGSCDMYLDHLRKAICNGSEEVYEYVLNWMAAAVQQPWEPGHTAIVLRGTQGTGKGTFAKTFARLFGRHGKQITDPKHLTGHFNSHLRDCVVMFADEAVAAEDRQQESMLKTLVTEESMMVTPKGKEASVERNYLHVIMASNSNWVVPVGVDDRRFVVLDVKEGHKQDREYWLALNQELQAGGYEALLFLLATRDITKFNPRVKPQTAALQEQKTLSFDPIAKWWYGVLQDGSIGDVVLTDGALVPTGYVSWDYNCTVPSAIRVANHIIHKFLSKAMLEGYRRRQATTTEMERDKVQGVSVHPHTGNTVDSERPNICIFPPLKQMREQFDLTHGGPYDWAVEPDAPKRDKVF